MRLTDRFDRVLIILTKKGPRALLAGEDMP